MVLLKIRSDVPAEQVDAVFSALADLGDRVPGILSFSGGPYSSDEGLQGGFTHGFWTADWRVWWRSTTNPDRWKLHPQVTRPLAPGAGGGLSWDRPWRR